MPGIAGIITTPDAPELGAELDLMADAMMHEKSYRGRKVRLPEAGAAIAWTGTEGSFADCAPAWNETRDVLLVFTGEEFSDAGEAARLRAAGHVFAADDASWIVHLYEEKGDAFLEQLNGTFAGVLLDRRQQRILLFNDRHGLSRLYWHDDGRAFRFASEAKALLRVRPELRAFDRRGLAERFACGCALEHRSLFAGVSLLPPAARWTFAPGAAVRRDTYFTLDTWSAQPPLAAPEFLREYAETLAAVVPRYFGGRQPAAAALAGGPNSRLLAAWAPHTPFLIPSYTFGGMDRPTSDVLLGAEVARRWQQYHRVIALDKGFFADFPGLAKRSVYYSDGAQDIAGAADLFVNRIAQGVAPVSVTGYFGGQVMREFAAMRVFPRTNRGFAREFNEEIRAAGAAPAGAPSEPCLSTIIRQELPWYHGGRLSVGRSQLAVRTPFLDNAIVRLQFRCPPAFRRNIDLALALIAAGDLSLACLPTDRGRVGPRRRFWRRPREWSAAAGARLDALCSDDMPQWLARRDGRLGRFNLDERFRGRHSGRHFRKWYRHELAGYVKDVLLDSRTLGREHLDRQAVEQLVAAHVAGTANHTAEIHQLLTFELIHRQFIDFPKGP